MTYQKETKPLVGNLFDICTPKPDSKWCKIMQEKYMYSNNPIRIITILDPPKGSTIWNFMISFGDVVTKYVSWEIHSGESAHLWVDSWNGIPLLNQMDDLEDVRKIATNYWGPDLLIMFEK